MNVTGSNKEAARNKLLIMYIIDKLIEADEAVLSSIMSETRLMNYFMMKQTIEELHEDGLLSKSVAEGCSFRQMTAEGKKALTLLEGILAKGVRKTLDRTLARYRNGAVSRDIYADFILKDDSGYVVTLGASENGFKIIEVVMAVGTREHAREICDNWKAHSADIYPELIESMIKKRGPS